MNFCKLLFITIITISCNNSNLSDKSISAPCDLSEQQTQQIHTYFNNWFICEDCIDDEWQKIKSVGDDIFCVIDFNAILSDSTYYDQNFEDIEKAYRFLGGTVNKDLVANIEFQQEYFKNQRDANLMKLESILKLHSGKGDEIDLMIQKYFN